MALSKAKIALYVLVTLACLSLATYVFWLRASFAEAKNKAIIFEETAKQKQIVIDDLIKNQESVENAVLEIAKLRQEVRQELDGQKRSLNRLILDNAAIKEWASQNVPQEIKNMLRPK